MEKETLKRIRDSEVERLVTLGADNSEAWATVNAGVLKQMIMDAINANIARLKMEEKRMKNWSNRRIAGWVKGRLEKAGLDIKENGNGSIYLNVYQGEECVCEIRIADHPQPVGGGYRGVGDLGDERFGESDILIDPDHPEWRKAVEKAIALNQETN